MMESWVEGIWTLSYLQLFHKDKIISKWEVKKIKTKTKKIKNEASSFFFLQMDLGSFRDCLRFILLL